MNNTKLFRFLKNSGAALHAPPPLGKIYPIAIILAGFMAMLALNLPGQLSYDSVIQLLDGRSGQYHTWHPPVMAFLLGLGDALMPGTGLFVIFNAALCFLSFAAILGLRDRITWLTVLAALGAVLTPQFLLYPGIVWKDVLFADAAMAGFVCLGYAGKHWTNVPARLGFLAGAVSLLLVAGLARQNGPVVLVIGALALGWIAAKQAGSKMGFAYGAGGLAAVFLLLVLSSLALNLRAAKDDGPAAQITLLKAYDIIGAQVADPLYRPAILESQAPFLAARMHDDGVRLYSPLKNDTLEASEALEDAITAPASAAPIAAQWRDLLLHRPWLYLRVRADVFTQVFLTPALRQCVPYYLGVDGPAEDMQQLHLTRRWGAADKFLANYTARFVGTPIFSHLAFALLALVLLVALLRRRRPVDIAIAGLLVATLIFSGSFFVISIACDYRYLYALDLSVLFALLYIL